MLLFGPYFSAELSRFWSENMNDPFKAVPHLLFSFFSNSDFGLGTFLPRLFCIVESWTLTLTESRDSVKTGPRLRCWVFCDPLGFVFLM